MELDFEKYCIVDGSPTTVLPAPHHHSKHGSRKSNGMIKCRKDLLNLNQNATEMSVSCKEVPPKQGSVYQSSKKANLYGQTDDLVGREKIELSRESASTLFLDGIIDSLCGSDEDGSSLPEPLYCKKNSINYSFSSESDKGSSNNYKYVQDLTVSRNSPRKKLDPFVKSRSHRTPSNFTQEISSEKISGNDPLSSPAHLHGILKSEKKNGVSFFEFTVKSTDDVYSVAKTWKADDALTWVYTFHTVRRKRNSNASRSGGFKDINRHSTMVGQMVISCYLCTELKGAGAFSDSIITEYVLYDIAQSRRSTWSRDKSKHDKNELPAKKIKKGRVYNNHAQPLAVAELRPEMERAAIIMQVPFEKRESLKFKSEADHLLRNSKDIRRVEEVRESSRDDSGHGKMHVVIPAGSHSLPSSESRGPSTLLDRWRLGGGCECGGWDIACPLDVFVNPNFRISEGQPLMDDRHPVQLFIQGRKDDDVPAFNMRRAIEEGKYAVDFHAQLSSLQAFSICVAILHAAEASTTSIGHEKSKRMLRNDSLISFAEEEIKNLIGAISEEERFKVSSKKEQVLPSSFVINPPFSPISRV